MLSQSARVSLASSTESQNCRRLSLDGAYRLTGQEGDCQNWRGPCGLAERDRLIIGAIAQTLDDLGEIEQGAAILPKL